MTRHKKKTPNSVQPQAAADRLRPWLLAGMTALFVARPLFPSESAATYGDGLSMVMLWIALAVFWLLGAVGRPRFSVRWSATDAAVLLLIVWYSASALLAVKQGTPRPALNMLWEWVGLTLCYFLARQLVVAPREARALAAVMIAAAVAVSAYGLYQCFYEMPQTRAVYAADPDRAMREAGLWFPAGSPERKAFEDRLNNTEPLAAFALTNSLAGFLVPWFVMLVGIMAVARRRRLWHMVLCLAPIAACLALTKSRSGYAAAVVGAMLALWFARQRKGAIPFSLSSGESISVGINCHPERSEGSPRVKTRSFAALRMTVIDLLVLTRKLGQSPGWKLPAAALGLIAALLLAAVAVEGTAVLGRATKSFGYRVQYWESSLRMIADHPWFGCGPGNFQETYPQYKLPEASEEIADPHNFLLEICATAGTPTALAFLAVLGCFWYSTSLAAAPTRCAGERDERAEGGGRRADKTVVSGQWSVASGEKVESGEWRVERESMQGNPPSALRSPPSSSPSSDAWPFILAGGALGFPLALPMGMLSAAPPSIVSALIGFPAAVAAILLLRGWIRGDCPDFCVSKNGTVPFADTPSPLPGWLPGVAVAALLIDLLASGGIGLPSVAGSFWLLLALGQEGRRPREFRPSVAWASLAVVMLLAGVCYWSAYGPVLRCQAFMRKAEREPSRAVAHLKAAAIADPLSAEPWRRLAAIAFDDWQREPNAAKFAQFSTARDKSLELAPNSPPAWLAAGDWALRAASAKDPRGNRLVADSLDDAIEYFRRAAELYPNSALHRAKLAEAYLAADDRSAFEREAKVALWLDKVTPHINKKLPSELRDLLLQTLESRKRGGN